MIFLSCCKTLVNSILKHNKKFMYFSDFFENQEKNYNIAKFLKLHFKKECTSKFKIIQAIQN